MTTSDLITSAGRRGAFTALLVAAMAVGTLTPSVLALLATFLIDDFGVTRAQVGMVAATFTVTAAVLSPFAGRAIDVVGGKLAFLGLFLVASAGFLTLAASPVFAALPVGAMIAGVAQSSTNPATNKLISLHLPLGRRGAVTGIKQSGVQVGAFVAGLVVPSIAAAFGWRISLVLVALVAVVLAPATLFLVPSDRTAASASRVRRGPLPVAVRWLAGYGFLLGLSGAALFLVPLFVEEGLGGSAQLGGVVAGVIAITSVFFRVLWARRADRLGRYLATLGGLAALAMVGWSGFLLAGIVADALVWPAAIVTGASAASWTSVGMLAVMDEAGAGLAGRASGLVMLGFLGGAGIGPPLYGWVVDITGSYTPMWVISVMVAGLGLALTVVWAGRVPSRAAGEGGGAAY